MWSIESVPAQCLPHAGTGWHQRAKATIAHHAITLYAGPDDVLFDSAYFPSPIAEVAEWHRRPILTMPAIRVAAEAVRNKRSSNRYLARHNASEHVPATTLVKEAGYSRSAALAFVTAGLCAPEPITPMPPQEFEASIGLTSSNIQLDSATISQIRESAEALRTNGIVVVYTPRFRRYGELTDTPGLVINALHQLGFTIIDRCAVVLDGARQHALGDRNDVGPSRKSRGSRPPTHQHIHEDLIVATVTK